MEKNLQIRNSTVEFLTFVLDGKEYFEHLLAEIREIRLSERRFYQKLTDIYSTAIDYSSDAATTFDAIVYDIA